MTPKCSICGQFAKIVDVGCHFGNSNDLEPPDDTLFCQTCVDLLTEKAIQGNYVPNYWLKPNWTLKVAEALECVEVAYSGCAWSFWRKANRPLEGNMELVERST